MTQQEHQLVDEGQSWEYQAASFRLYIIHKRIDQNMFRWTHKKNSFKVLIYCLVDCVYF